jgi:hypothetical protein
MRPLLRWGLFVLLGAAGLGCGDGTVILFRTNLGTIDRDATCSPTGGEFPLRQLQGLVVIVIFDSDSAIVLPNGKPGTCDDLVAGARANVSGIDEDGSIRASEVHLLGN